MAVPHRYDVAVLGAIGAVARQNRQQLIDIGSGYGQVQGVVNGQRYVLGVSNGRIGQFYRSHEPG